MPNTVTLAYKPDTPDKLDCVERVCKIEQIVSETIPIEVINTAEKIVKHVLDNENRVSCIVLLRALYQDLSLRAAKMAIEYAIKESNS